MANKASFYGAVFESTFNRRDGKMLGVWAELFGLQTSDPNLYITLGNYCAELDDLSALIRATKMSDRGKDLYLKAIEALRPFVEPSRVGGLQLSALKSLKDRVDLLFLAADSLPDELQPEVLKPTRNVLIKELSDLITTARQAELDPIFRPILIRTLESLLFAIRSYDDLGPQGAAKVFGMASAELARAAQTASKRGGDAEQSLIKRSIAATRKVGAAVIFAGAVTAGAAAVIEDGNKVVDTVMEQIANDGSPGIAE